MIKIIGFEKREGEFTPEDRPNEMVAYKNYLFHFVTNENNNVTGLATSLYGNSVIKVSDKNLMEIAGVRTPDELIDKCVIPHYVPGRNNQVRLGRLEIVPESAHK